MIRPRRRASRGMGQTGYCPDAYGNDPCAPGGDLYSLPLSSTLTNLNTQITGLELQAGISATNPLMITYAGIPGWAWLAIGGVVLLMVSGMTSGARR